MKTTTSPSEQIALAYRKAGLCVLPANVEQKRPALAAWKEYQTRLPTEDELRAWFATDRSMCIIAGAISGNNEMLDFDCAGELFERWCNLVRVEAPGLIERLVFERTQSGGVHVSYCCQSPVCGSMKLAMRASERPDDQPIIYAGKQFVPRKVGKKFLVTIVLIETRGEGGLYLCDPSPGYKLFQGSFEHLPVLTAQEREVLLEAAYSLNEYLPETIDPSAASSHIGGIRPGDDFNARGDVREVLRKHDWVLAKAGDNEHWRRPGKTVGCSATLKNGVLYVFSSNAAPFEQNRAYSPFAVYAMLEHGGDFNTAAQELSRQGYGSQPADAGVDLSQFKPAHCPELIDPPTIWDLINRHPTLREPVIHGLLRRGETMNVIAAPKTGKALAIDTPILTETGWMTMGDLQPGMRVHAGDGSLTEIVAVSDIMHDRPCYHVKTKSGSCLVADENHLWTVLQQRRTNVVTTAELGHGYRGRRWLLPVAGALERPHQKLPLDPWLLGYWLGNGTAREGTLSANERDAAEVIAEVLRAGFAPGRITRKRGSVTFTVLGLKAVLRSMGLLYRKQVPEQYLLASRQQRAAVLAGLLDSDGHAHTQPNGAGYAEFCTTDDELFYHALTLIRSLGHKPCVSIGRASLNGEDLGSKLRITFAASRGNPPFQLKRRINGLPARAVSERSRRDAIVSVTPVPSVPVRCIQVAHPTGLFLAGAELTVTHNSWLVNDLALAVATGGKWLDTFACESGDVLILDNELHAETSAHRIPKVADVRGIMVADYGKRLRVQNMRGQLRDVFSLGGFFNALAPGRFRVIILDAFYRFMPADMDENDNGTMANIYNHIDLYADRLGCCFILIHHSTKGNQSAKAVTDVGAGAGSQSRATDTHLVLRPHEEPGAVVLDAAVRSWPPIEPMPLRWSFPVWSPAPDLDPNMLRSERPKRKQATEEQPDEWTPARFAAELMSPTPQRKDSIIQAAQRRGMSRRQAERLLQQSEGECLAFRWYYASNLPIEFSTLPQPGADGGGA